MTILLNELDTLIKRTRDPALKRRAAKLRDKLAQRPMPEILNLVPGETVIAKAKACGVSRQTFYTWLNGSVPHPKQAARLAKITGISIAEIRGSAPRSAAPAP
jgi:DNA invertase Pin-like site-specific DNA recombinase